MKKQIIIVLFVIAALSLSTCKKGTLSAARDVTGIWKGTLVYCENNASNANPVSGVMVLDLTVDGNDVTGMMYFSYYSGSLTGTISGVNIDFTSDIGNGCINVHGTFTSTNMDGMKDSSPPPYLSCGAILNDGHGGSKGIEWHLTKQ